MRTAGPLLATLLISLGLASCGKPASAPTGSEGEAAAPASAPAAGLTDEQKKTVLASLPAPYSAADPVHGAQVFLVCKSCHTLVEGGANMTGPNLHGMFGAKAAAVTGFNYSEPMKAAGIVWTPEKLDQWLADPKALVPGTKMSFVGLKSAQDRADVIAYIKVETTPAP